MGRRRKEGGAEVIMGLIATLPWWGGVAVAIASYVIFHALSVAPAAASLKPGQTGGFAVRAMVASLSYALQFVIPLLSIVAAGISFARARKREGLVEQVAQSPGTASLNGMTWLEFELLVGESFRLQGYAVTEHGGAAPDGGVDLVLRKGNEIFLVQCKQWKAYKVSVEVVRELYGVMAARGAAGGFVVTSGTFTSDAREFAAGLNVKLIDGPRLFGLIQQAKASLTRGSRGVAPETRTVPSAAAQAPVGCPSCGSNMMLRTAKKGSNAGAQFWGCSTYPACKATR